MTRALREHWPETLMEAAGLGIFMVSACFFATSLEHPSSPLRLLLEHDVLRRALMGLAMGWTAIGIIYSPWGQQSGAHVHPAVTLTFFRLGKIAPWDAVFYVVAQFCGAVAGVLLSTLVLREALGTPEVNYVVTLPGMEGVRTAFLAELAISFGLMMTVLVATNHRRLAWLTGVFAGVLVAAYIAVEAPRSGMSMNPARSFGSGVVAWLWTAHWVYFTAPPLGMLLAAELYLRARGAGNILCAKLHHRNDKRCIFRCGYRSRSMA